MLFADCSKITDQLHGRDHIILNARDKYDSKRFGPLRSTVQCVQVAAGGRL